MRTGLPLEALICANPAYAGCMKPDVMEAWASLVTAICTSLTLIAVAVYTVVTTKMYRESRVANQEALRPVLILFEVQQDGSKRLAIFENTGQGLALEIKRNWVEGNSQRADSNALAPGQRLLLDVSETPKEKVFGIRYSSLAGKQFMTISAYQNDERVLNHYIPDAASIDKTEIEALRKELEKKAVMTNIANRTRPIIERPDKPADN